MSFIKQTFQCNLRTERLTKNHYCNENINTITSLNSSGPLNYSSACLKHFLLVQRAHELVTWKHRCIIFLMCKLSVVTYARQLLTFKIRDSVQQNTHFFSVCYLKQPFTLFNLPNWSFFMTATYFSSRDRKTDKGLGFTAAFLEYSAIFFSVVQNMMIICS